jgi:ubiquinone/menaquinone biosynthesis C-methylase UbiE
MRPTGSFEERYRAEHEPWSFSARAAELLRYEWIVNRVARLTPRRVLDAGCSIGQLTTRLASLPAEIHALDVSPTAVSRARETVARHGMVRFTTGSATELPYADGTFDLVIASDGLYSWDISADDRQASLRELHRVLRPDGVALLTEHMRKQRFEEFVSEVRASPLRVNEVAFLYDRPWYQFESWLRAIQHWRVAKALRRNLTLGRFLLRLGRLFGSGASRHICVIAKR